MDAAAFRAGKRHAGGAWREVWAGIKAETRQFLVYALLRVVLPTIAMIGLFVVLLIPGLILAGSVGAIIYAVHTAFASSTGGAAVAGALLQAFFGVVAFVFMLLATICLGGPLSTGTREYALTFYGGRYRVLGDILDSPVPPRTGAPQLARRSPCTAGVIDAAGSGTKTQSTPYPKQS